MSEKVFTKKMTLSICLILLCLCALSISAGAFFSDTAKSNTKTFSTATYDLTITATKQVTTLDSTDPQNPTQVVTPNVPVVPTASDSHIYELEVLPDADKSEGYSVKIQIKQGISATSSGYCKIVIEDKANPSTVYGTYYTKQIAIAEHADPQVDITTLRNIVIKTEKNIVVKFIPLWGTYSGDDALADNAVIEIPAP